MLEKDQLFVLKGDIDKYYRVVKTVHEARLKPWRYSSTGEMVADLLKRKYIEPISVLRFYSNDTYS